MDDVTDQNISLNLSNSGSDLNLFKRRTKIYGNRTQRIKQRKSIKHQRTKDFQPQESADVQARSSAKRKRDSSVSELEEDSSPKRVKKQQKNGSSTGGVPTRNTSKGVISSLFRHNPEIPKIAGTNVQGVKEEVFASSSFSDLHLHPHLVSVLEQQMSLTTMTRVQQLSIPVILQSKDVLIKSQTGSGKTLAYAVPIVHTLAGLKPKCKRQDGPYVVVIVPTRELAVQSYETFVKLLRSAIWVVAGNLMGGENRKAEKSRIRKGINILVATPGRLLDHVQHTSSLLLSRVRWLVIDEADRLLEMGYEKDITQIVTALSNHGAREQQTILLSATLTAGVERLAGMTLKDHEMIDASQTQGENIKSHSNVSKEDQSDADIHHPEFSLPEKLKQHFVMVPCKLRLVTLAAFILWKCKLQARRSKMVVFLSTQSSVEFHFQLFTQVLGSSSTSVSLCKNSEGEQMADESDDEDYLEFYRLHGDMSQKERTKVFQCFTSTESGILLCTDVAARGLHLPRVDWIVQYTTPGATVDYIHRVGRTARAGKQGNALLFLMPSEAEYVKELNKHKISLSEISVEDILMSLLPAIHDLPKSELCTQRHVPRTFEEAATFMQDRLEEAVLKDYNMQTLAAKGYQSFVRAYTTYPSELKKIFSMKELHLGHVAKSFALRHAPSQLHTAASRPIFRSPKGKGKPRFPADLQRRKRPFSRKLPLSSTVSEFGSGL